MLRTDSKFRLWVGIALAAIALSSAGCGGGGGGGGATDPLTDTTAPTITGVRADVPASFSFVGGNVALSASVADNVAVAIARAHVTRDGVELSPSGLSVVSGSTYGVVYPVPGNATAEAQSYTVHIWAQDSSGNTSESGPVTFDVPPAGGAIPPPPPAP